MRNGGTTFLLRPYRGGIPNRRFTSFLLAAGLSGGIALAQDGYWINSSGGSWANGANWDYANGMAGGADNTAYFGFAREASISPNVSFTLDGAQTIGNLCFTTQGGPANWSFNAGAGGSLTLHSTLGTPAITITSPSLQVTLNAVVAGPNGFEKDGPGTLVLGAFNTYAGPTTVTGGALNVNGSITGGVTVRNATLGGIGSISGPVVIGSGGTLSLGNGQGPLTINNSLTLQPGSTTYVTVNAANSSQAFVRGLTRVTYGGTLIVNNLSGTPSLGQTFSIFGAAASSGNFVNIEPPPGPWLRWRIDPSAGQITVVSSGSQPTLSNPQVQGPNLIFHVTSGPPGSPGYVLASPDLNLPKSQWTPVGTNCFDMSGNFTFTNFLNPNTPGQIFLSTYVVPAP